MTCFIAIIGEIMASLINHKKETGNEYIKIDDLIAHLKAIDDREQERIITGLHKKSLEVVK